MIEEACERAMRPVAQAGPQIDMGGERSVVSPHTVVPEPAGFGRNIFLRTALQQRNVSAHNGIVLLKYFSWENGMRERPLRGLRTRTVPQIGIGNRWVIVRNHGEILESRGMPHHLSLCHLLKCLIKLAKEFAGACQ